MAEGRRPSDTDVILARSPVLCTFFGRIMRRQMRRHFHAVRISKAGQPRLPGGRAAIVYSNHPSWWDPALFIVLSTTLLQNRTGYGPMDAAALARYGFMRRIGVFGIEPGGRRGAADFLRTGRRILEDPSAILWVTAGGDFADPRVRPVRLRPGVAHLMAAQDGLVAVPLAMEYPFWTERSPEALCRFGEPLQAGGASVAEWQRRLEEGLSFTMEALAADAITHDPALFDLVLEGSAGIGGIYDLFRRGRALVRGERFVPEHGGPRT
jgi:1-acyl-sn-glycerol-3-phosphate acyltransferase